MRHYCGLRYRTSLIFLLFFGVVLFCQPAYSGQKDEFSAQCHGIGPLPDSHDDGRPRWRGATTLNGTTLNGHEIKITGGFRLEFGGYIVCGDEIILELEKGPIWAKGSVVLREPDGTITRDEKVFFNEKWQKGYSIAYSEAGCPAASRATRFSSCTTF
jgi:hypothetical protein